MRALLIEDDPMIGNSLFLALSEEGMGVNWITDGINGLQAAESGEHQIVLLDLGLPGKSGFEVLRTLRTNGCRTPLLIITAKDEMNDVVSGLDLGADDYLVKPFGVGELIARIHAVMRRNGPDALACMGNGEITVSLSSHKMSYRGKTILLTAREFSLMCALLEYPGRILSRSQIEQCVYRDNEEIESNAVDVLIHSLRKKFDKEVIRNVRGLGWMVVRPGS